MLIDRDQLNELKNINGWADIQPEKKADPPVDLF